MKTQIDLVWWLRVDDTGGHFTSTASERTEGEREGCSVGEMVNKANGCNKLEFLGRKILIELVLVERTQSMQW